MDPRERTVEEKDRPSPHIVSRWDALTGPSDDSAGVGDLENEMWRESDLQRAPRYSLTGFVCKYVINGYRRYTLNSWLGMDSVRTNKKPFEKGDKTQDRFTGRGRFA